MNSVYQNNGQHADVGPLILLSVFTEETWARAGTAKPTSWSKIWPLWISSLWTIRFPW